MLRGPRFDKHFYDKRQSPSFINEYEVPTLAPLIMLPLTFSTFDNNLIHVYIRVYMIIHNFSLIWIIDLSVHQYALLSVFQCCFICPVTFLDDSVQCMIQSLSLINIHFDPDGVLLKFLSTMLETAKYFYLIISVFGIFLGLLLLPSVVIFVVLLVAFVVYLVSATF